MPALAAQASVVTRYTDGTARGGDQREATALAIVDAAGRAFGLALQVDISSNSEEVVVSDGDTFDEMYLQKMNSQIRQSIEVPTHSPITGYSVNNAIREADGKWRVDLTIEYAWYEQLGGDSDRRSLVVMTGGSDFETRAQKALQQGLVSERRFNILERDLTGLFLKEESFVKSLAAGADQIARLGHGAGADYLVAVSIENVHEIEQQPVPIKASGETNYVTAIDFDYRIKVVEFASREIKLVLGGRFQRQASRATGTETIDHLLTRFGRETAQQITSAIYPMQLSLRDGGLGVVNRGSGVLSTGQVLEAFRLGVELIDPDSGESLDAYEEFVGVVTVTDVKPKYSLVAIQSKELFSDSDTFIVRFPSPEVDTGAMDLMRQEFGDAAKRKTSIYLQ